MTAQWLFCSTSRAFVDINILIIITVIVVAVAAAAICLSLQVSWLCAQLHMAAWAGDPLPADKQLAERTVLVAFVVVTTPLCFLCLEPVAESSTVIHGSSKHTMVEGGQLND